ncbi:MAG: hypothetical protein HLUCCA12_05300 [Rhodobacteraceae bacterium HLUCCA12]|nr:MAG: hypothetical protein HLUCCA12_05300 [Rhodobacteraceae bacterium HLUCCA12]
MMRRCIAAGILVLSVLAGAAQARAPAASPVPPQRPVVAIPDRVERDGALAPATSLRPPRHDPAARARHARAVPRAAGAQTPGPARSGLCGRATLAGRSLPPIAGPSRGCDVDDPVSVTHVAGIRLSQPATLECDTARAFDDWVRGAMLPALGNAGGGVAQIRVAAHYACRPRNNRPGARISEHGRGRAIDIAGVVLSDGQSVMVLDDWRRGRFSDALQRMHQAACGIFRTTLGPGSDGHHEDHLHFDLAQRRGGGTYCR